MIYIYAYKGLQCNDILHELSYHHFIIYEFTNEEFTLVTFFSEPSCS